MNVAQNKEIARQTFDARRNLDSEGFLAPLAEDVTRIGISRRSIRWSACLPSL
jgi:ketosteroid isomerase-like protein